MGSIRKSSRARTLTAKVKDNALYFNTTTNVNLDFGNKRNIENLELNDNNQQCHNNSNNSHKKRKVTAKAEEAFVVPQDDKIDPVEKLLSYTNINNDFLLDLDSDFIVSSPELSHDDEEEYDDDSDAEDDEEQDIQQVDFTKILHDNIRQYCSNFKKSPIEIYSNPTFALLNRPSHNQSVSSAVTAHHQQQIQVQRHHNSEPSHTVRSHDDSITSIAGSSVMIASPLTSTTTTAPSTPTNHNEVPFFRTVNFSGPSKKQHQQKLQNSKFDSFDEYFSYGDEIKVEKIQKTESLKKFCNTKDFSYNYEDEDEDYISPTDKPKPKEQVISVDVNSGINNTIGEEVDDESPLSTPITNNKMSFHWRQNHNNLNLALNDFSKSTNHHDQQQFIMDQQNEDIYKILNKHSILTGKASEMISTGNFLINDFFI